MTKSQRTKLNKLLRQAMIHRDGEKCLKCGKTTAIHTSHIKSRQKYRKLAFDLDNVKPLCYKCHLHWWHKEPLEAGEWIKTAISYDRLKRLELKAKSINKAKLEYQTIKERLEDES